MISQMGAIVERWSGKPHPRLLLIATMAAAFIAMILLIAAVTESVILYKEF